MENGATTALATTQRADALAPYQPRDLKEAYQLAEYIADSQLFARFDTAPRALIAMAFAAEFDVPLTAALRGLYTHGDSPSLAAEFKVALVMKHPECEYFRCVETTDEVATYETKRRGREPRTLSFTIANARRAGLPVDDPEDLWYKFPRRCLRARCSSELTSLEYPDVVFGLPTEEEMARFSAAPAPRRDDATTKPSVVLDAELPEPLTPPPPVSSPVAACSETAAQRADRLVAACRAATSKKELPQISREAADLDGPERERVLAAYAEASTRLDAPKEVVGRLGSISEGK